MHLVINSSNHYPLIDNDISQVFTTFILEPLKLSAPTSLMQNANTDATLVCHANKPFDDCLWTTPYGKTYSFKPNKPSVSHENGRLAYFGFADTDCGVIVHNVQARDNGGWLCQLHSHGGGGIFQNATDIVPLFAGKPTNFHFEYMGIASINIF